MSELRKSFEEAKKLVEENRRDPDQRIVNILRKVKGEDEIFDPDKLIEHGIDPFEFMTALAQDYAQSTLLWHDKNPPYINDLIRRCRVALSTDTNLSLGHYLSDELKSKVQAKLATNLPGIQPKQP